MVETLKKMDKKFLIFAVAIIMFPIVLVILLAIVRGCSNSKMTYTSYEKKMISATERYLKGKLPKEESGVKTISLSKLVDKGYIRSPKKALKDDSCEGSVTVRMNGSSIETNNGGFLNYTVDLKCKTYKTTHLIDKITEVVVTSESGLYKDGNEYIFRGNKVNNYINFYGINYRIMSTDEDGFIKLIKDSPEPSTRYWDNKYNVEVDSSYGKNIYKDSSILSYLLSDYQNSKRINKKAKQHMVAHDVCVGKRNSNDYSISKDLDCSEILENQIVSLINVSDYARASIDPNCTTTISKSCKNYNYLSNVSSSSWTTNSIKDNTYEVLFLSDGVQEIQNANTYNEYNVVIYIDGSEIYQGGRGTLSDPYILD